MQKNRRTMRRQRYKQDNAQWQSRVANGREKRVGLMLAKQPCAKWIAAVSCARPSHEPRPCTCHHVQAGPRPFVLFAWLLRRSSIFCPSLSVSFFFSLSFSSFRFFNYLPVSPSYSLFFLHHVMKKRRYGGKWLSRCLTHDIWSKWNEYIIVIIINHIWHIGSSPIANRIKKFSITLVKVENILI